MSVGKAVLAVVLTNAGGEGKTTWSETLAALARLGGLKVSVADIDPGNRGYLNRNGDSSAVSLDWAGLEFDASDPEKWFDTHVRGRDLTILDTGANMLAAGGKTGEFLMGLLNLASANDLRVIFYCVTSPNKAGSGSLVELMYQRFSRAGEIVIVQNNRDGSGAFKASLASMGTAIIDVPFFPSGLLEVRLRRKIPLDEVLRDPEGGYERATGLIAAKLVPLAQQDAVLSIVGEAVLAELYKLSAEAPSGFFYTLSKLRDASNSRLTANERLDNAWIAFNKCDEQNEAVLLATDRELRAALASWRILA